MYYLYRHIRLDTNKPFYIGIGKKMRESRIFGIKTEYRRAYHEKWRSKFWRNIVSRASYEVEILYESDSEREIKEKEREFIKLYGRRDLGLGELVNQTDGGDGIESFKHSIEARRKISEALRRRPRKRGYKLNMTEEGRKSLSLKMKDRAVSEKTREKMSISMLGNKYGIRKTVEA